MKPGLLNSQTLRHSLADWVEIDIATYYVAVALGIAPDPGKEWTHWGNRKDLFWSANILGIGLIQLINTLVDAGVLERNENDDLFYRWNKDFNYDTTYKSLE